MSEALVVAALVLCALSGLLGLTFPRGTARGQKVACWLLSIGCLLGIAGAVHSMVVRRSELLLAPWPVPGGELAIEVDVISAIFVFQIFLVSMLGSIYGIRYWKQEEHLDDGRKVFTFYGFLTAGMALLIVAKNGLLFLAGWEIMAASAFILVSTEDRSLEVRQSGLLYILSTRVSTLCLFATFALLYATTGGFDFARSGESLRASPGIQNAIFLFSLVGFGLKAGLMPLHIWLPPAHANAPTHVSAVMSGVLIKTGIYGMVRICSMFGAPPIWWGILLLILGAISAVIGVVYAVGQHDLKRLLAYHSVENIGIIFVGLGVATLGRSLGRADLVALGVAGALLHVVNHGLFKALLFLSAGAVIHAAKTREIDKLGGLLRTMPKTALAFLIGAVAICGLPPLNGFVSELLIYLGLLRVVQGADQGLSVLLGAAFAVPALGMAGALALACFVKVFGAVFLGTRRGPAAAEAHEAPRAMLLPMQVLCAGCLVIGLAPILVAPVLDQAGSGFAPELASFSAPVASLAPLATLSFTGILLLAAIALGSILLGRRLARESVGRALTWDCGYAAPASSMQYTASSFAEMLVRYFRFAVWLRAENPKIETAFPRRAGFHSLVRDLVLDRALLPVGDRLARLGLWFRWIQRGSLHAYLLYVLLAALLLHFFG